MPVRLLDKYRLADYPNRINWEITRVCNFSCPYCVNRQMECDTTSRIFSPSEIATFFDRTGMEWLVLITGGEPFMYPQFAEVCKSITHKHHIQITSNLSHNDVELFAEIVDPEKVFLFSASFHATERKGKDMRNNFVAKCRLLKNRGFNVLINYIAHPDIFAQLENDIEYFNSEGFETFVLVLRGSVKGKKYPEAYTPEEWDTMNKYVLDQDVELKAAFGNLDFYGRYCNAGKSYFFMKPDGTISRCASLQKSCGNFFDGSFTMAQKPKPCLAHNCYDVYCGLAALTNKKASRFTLRCNEKKYFDTGF